MTYEEDGIDLSFTAGATLAAKQYYFVKMSADNTVIACTAITDVPVGVVQNKPASGEQARVRIHGVTRVACGAAITYGQFVGPHTDGTGKGRTLVIGNNYDSIPGICLVGGDTSTPATVLLVARGTISS